MTNSKTTLAYGALLLSGALCISATVSDAFTSAGVGAAWVSRAFSGGATAQVGGKLCFSSVAAGANSAADDYAIACYLCKTHKLVFNAPWAMDMDYSLTVPAMTGYNTAGAGGVIQFGYTAANATTVARVLNGYTWYICRTSTGYSLFLSEWMNGEEVDSVVVSGLAASGHIKIAYTSTSDTMQVYVNNVLKQSIPHFYRDYVAADGFGSVAHFGIGGASSEGTSFFTFSNKVMIDNFAATGNGVVVGQ